MGRRFERPSSRNHVISCLYFCWLLKRAPALLLACDLGLRFFALSLAPFNPSCWRRRSYRSFLGVSHTPWRRQSACLVLAPAGPGPVHFSMLSPLACPVRKANALLPRIVLRCRCSSEHARFPLSLSSPASHSVTCFRTSLSAPQSCHFSPHLSPLYCVCCLGASHQYMNNVSGEAQQTRGCRKVFVSICRRS